jgi:hypothetical protein
MRVSNKACMLQGDPISPLSRVHVAGFPPTVKHLRELDNATSVAIIAAYAIPGQFATLSQRRQAIADYIGVIRF